jgi:hypothetical protein
LPRHVCKKASDPDRSSESNQVAYRIEPLRA